MIIFVDYEFIICFVIFRAIRAAGLDCPISVDTRHSVVASAAIKAGAGIINDVSGGTHDPDMIPLSQSACVPMIYMHMRGSPQTMTQPEYCNYSNPPADVARELALQLEAGCSTGIPRWMQMVDPGFGFAKQADICQDLLRPKNLRLLRQLLKDRPVMIGLSRKRFLETMLLKAPTYASQTSISATERDSATVGGCIAALLSGSSPDREALSSLILRVHNVKATHDACVVLTKLIS